MPLCDARIESNYNIFQSLDIPTSNFQVMLAVSPGDALEHPRQEAWATQLEQTEVAAAVQVEMLQLRKRQHHLVNVTEADSEAEQA